jgi:hypothetical protein
MASPSVTVVTPRLAQSISTAIQQRVAATKKFTGALPQLGAVRADSPIARGNCLYKYAQLAADGGGLFFWNNAESLILSQIHLDLGAAGDTTISIVNLDPATLNDDLPAVIAGESMPISITTAQRLVVLNEAQLKTVLLPYQGIQIVTTNSGAAQIAQVTVSIERTFMR